MPNPKLLMVGWDAADWSIADPLIDEGKLPQLAQIVKNGTSGAIRSIPPFISPVLWTSIATGKSPAEHGIAGFTEYNPKTRKVQATGSHSRKVKALWNILSQSGFKTSILGWFASHPAEAISGTCVAETFAKLRVGDDPQQVPTGSVAPADAIPRLAKLRVTPEKVDLQLLGFFIPRIKEIDLRRDKRPDKLLELLSELYSIHNAAVATLQDDPDTDFLAVYYHFLDLVSHEFMIYGGPRRPDVSARDFNLYSKVVEQAYRLQDLLLADLISYATPDVNCLVLSDHGFLSGSERPTHTPKITAGLAAWHRPEGLVAMAGPGFRAGARVHGARLYDITPTILHLFDLPVGSDMEGRVLLDAFQVTSIEPTTVESWENRGPTLESFQTHHPQAEDSSALLDQFAALGYLELRDNPFASPTELTRRENAWSLGLALLDDHRYEEALPTLEEAFFLSPEEIHIASPLAQCQIALGLKEEARQSIECIEDSDCDDPGISLLLGEIYGNLGDYRSAFSHLRNAERLGGDPKRVRALEGLTLLKAKRFEEAEKLFRQLVEGNVDASFRLGLCRSLLRQGKFEEATPLIRDFVEQHPGDANGWFTFGQVLNETENSEEASKAFKTALEINPHFLNAKINWSSVERERLASEGHFIPFTEPNLDFSNPESPQDRLRKDRSEKINRIREESKMRRQKWITDRDESRASSKMIEKFDKDFRLSGADPIIIVSGLPRSGTSMLMQILGAGGIPLKTDPLRPADEHNPKGYYEWSEVRRLHQEPDVIRGAAGAAVKVVSTEITHLPLNLNYRIIWMDRPLNEVLVSQNKMLASQSPDPDTPTKEISASELGEHRDRCLETIRKLTLQKDTRTELLEINYHSFIENPMEACTRVQTFLGSKIIDAASMQKAIDPALWRNRE
ncbi:MAG: alkaline phosphatase family protein [Verrucomicrobiota bacterium]